MEITVFRWIFMNLLTIYLSMEMCIDVVGASCCYISLIDKGIILHSRYAAKNVFLSIFASVHKTH